MEAAPARHALKIDVNRQSKGPQHHAYSRSTSNGAWTERTGCGGDGGVRLAITHTWLADSDRTDPGHHLALRQVTVADDTLVAVRGLQIGMFAEKVRNLGLDRQGEKGTCPVAQDFCELISDPSFLHSS